MSPWWLITLAFLVIFGMFAYDCSRDVDRYFKEVNYKEHTYLIFNGRGICHSPECKCQTKGRVE